MSIQEQRRKAFDQWCRGNPDVTDWTRGPSGDYQKPHINAWWNVWNTALDSVEIELPAEKPMSHNHEREAARLAFNDALEECRAAIEAAGLKVKP